MSLRVFFLPLVLLLPACTATHTMENDLETARRPPNLVLIVTDDQGWWDVGFNGCTDIPTPNLDRIADEGVRFSEGYVTYSVCGPSRAGLITGRYQDRFGASRNPTIDPSIENNGVPRSERNLAELLGPQGYATMAIGKWHLGTHVDLRPRVRGFDEFYGFLSGGHDYFPERLTIEDLESVEKKYTWYRTKLLHNGERVVPDAYLTDALSDMAVDFVARKKDQPFFLYLAYNAPHTPLQATEEYLERFAHIEDKQRRKYAAMVSAVDDGVGKVLEEIDRQGLSEDTLVVYLSDNGGATNNGSINDPLRGRKGSLYEGGVRVPFAMRWPGSIPAGLDYDHPVLSLDIAATIVKQAGAEVPADKPLDGVDLQPYLDGTRSDAPHETLYWRKHNKQLWAVRRDGAKLVHGEDGVEEYFDLKADVAESADLSSTSEARMRRLRKLYAAWEEQMIDPIYPGLGSWDFPD
ncbi:MAG: sulfatase-like hydrolase/transferase [Planctomycetota bacterium]|jgi:arylsulfatase A-like enzyme